MLRSQLYCQKVLDWNSFPTKTPLNPGPALQQMKYPHTSLRPWEKTRFEREKIRFEREKTRFRREKTSFEREKTLLKTFQHFESNSLWDKHGRNQAAKRALLVPYIPRRSSGGAPTPAEKSWTQNQTMRIHLDETPNSAVQIQMRHHTLQCIAGRGTDEIWPRHASGAHQSSAPRPFYEKEN